MESGVSPWPVVETTKITASSLDNKLCEQSSYCFWIKKPILERETYWIEG